MRGAILRSGYAHHAPCVPIGRGPNSAQTVSKRTATRIDEALSRRKLRLSLHMPNSKSPTSFIAED